MTYLPNIHTDEETFYFIANIVLRDQDVLVAETNGEISGFLAVHGDMVEHLYVHPDLLRRGIGSALLQRAKERLPSGFRLWVFQQNVPARGFYERTGSGPSRRPMAAGTRNGRRMPFTSGGPPIRSRGPRTAAAWPSESGHASVTYLGRHPLSTVAARTTTFTVTNVRQTYS
jgi:hypothetical protein